MSTTIDERVVEMRFDNKQFESNVATSMSTLEKLKKSLNLSGASKGLEDVNTAAKRVDMSGLGGAVETVKAKFSALDVVAITALANITNSAVNAGKRIVSALTIDPIKTGFQEYETQINSVQTILANTSSKGTTLDQVNTALDELNHYADLTIYNFTEMTRNIGTFTAAGIDLNTSVNAIQGIANLAAVSGSTSQQASTAMYQLSQALASGTVKLMDWNSVVNAGMGGEVFQNALKETSRLLGTGADAAIEAQGSFRESLSTGWLTAEVLTETLKKFTTSGANEYVAEYTGLSSEAVQAALDNAKAQYGEADAIKQASQALAEKSGKNASEIESILSMAKTAEDAATKVKTFSQLLDTLKEAAQSGWTQSWELIIGDFEEAKESFTKIHEILSGAIESASNSRNNILEGALGSNWDTLINKVNEAGIETDVFEKKVRECAKSGGEDIDSLITKYGSLKEAFRNGLDTDYLKEAFKELSGSATETIKGLSVDLADIFPGKFGESTLSWGSTATESVEKVQTALTELGFTLESGINGVFGNETREAVIEFQKSVGLVANGIVDQATIDALIEAGSAIEQVGEASEKTETSIDDLVDGVGKLGGRELLFGAIQNTLEALVKVIGTFRDAWGEIFTSDRATSGLYNALDMLHSFSEKLIMSEETADKLKRTLKGAISVLDIIYQAFKAVASGIGELIGNFSGLGGGILDVTAAIGDFLSNLGKSTRETNLFGAAVDKIVGFVSNIITRIKELGSVGKELGSSLIDGFETPDFEGVLGFFTGLFNIITKIGSAIASTFGKLGGMISEALGKGDMFEVLNSGVLVGILLGVKKFTSSLSDALENVGGFTENVKGILDDVRGCLQAYQNQLNAGALLKIAGAVAILAASLFLLSNIDEESLGPSIAAVTTLLVELVAAMTVMNKIGGNSKLFDTSAKKMIAMSLSILILSSALKSLSGLNWEEMAVGLVAISALLWELVAVSVVMSKTGSKMVKGSIGLIALAAAIKILASACKDFSDMSWQEIGKGLASIGALLIEISIFENIAGKAKHVISTGLSMLLISASMKILASALSDLGSIAWPDIAKGLTAMGIAMAELALVMRLIPKGSIFKATGLLIAVASLKLLANVLSYFEDMEWDGICKGLLVIGVALSELAIGLNLMRGTVGGAAALLIAAVALAAIAPTIKALGNMGWDEIAKGLIVLAGAFAIVGLAGLLLKPLIVPLLGLAAAFALLGVGMVGIGAGLTLVATGLTALGISLAASATSIVAAITVIVSGILELVPTIARIIGEGIVELARVIGEYAPQLADSGLKLILGVLQSLAENAPQITDALLNLLVGVINSLSDHTPALIEALFNLMSSVFKGLVEALKNMGIRKIQDGIDAALGLSALMVAMSLALKVAGGVRIGSAVKGILVLTAMAVPLLAFVGVLALADGIDNATNNALALSALIGTCSLMLLPLTLIGNFIGSAILGVVALTTMAVPMLAFIGVLAVMNNVNNAITNAKILGEFMETMADVLVKVGLVSPLAALGVGTMTALALLMGAIGVLAVGIGALMDKFPSIQKFLNTGLPVLEQLAGSIGTMIGNFTGGILEGVGSSLVKIGEDISGFISQLVTASENASGIDGSSFKGVKDLLLTLAEIGGVSVLTTITDFFTVFTTGQTSIEKIGNDGVAFFKAMQKIGEASSEVNINEESMSSIIAIADKLSGLQSSLEPIGGFSDWLSGRDDLATFGENASRFIESMKTAFGSLDGIEAFNTGAIDQIVSVGTSLSTLQNSLQPIESFMGWLKGKSDLATFGENASNFITSMKTAFGSLDGIETFNTGAIDQIVSAATSLSTLQSSLEPIGGVIRWFTGRTDLGTFGVNVSSFIESMKTAFGSLDGIETFNTGAIDQIITAATNLSALQSSLASIDGIVEWFKGKSDLGTFGANVSSFIASMKTAFGSLDGIETFNTGAIDQIVSAATSLSTLQSSLTPMGGVITWFTGRTDLGTFGINIGLFADAMGKLKSGMGENGISEAVTASITNAGNAIIALQSALPTEHLFDGKMNLTEFSTYITNFGKAMSSFSTTTSSIDDSAISIAINAARRIKNLIISLSDLDTSGLSDFIGGSFSDGAAVNIAQAMSKFSKEVSDINVQAVSTSVTTAIRLRTLINTLSGLDSSDIAKFKPVSVGEALKSYSNSVANLNTAAINNSISVANKVKAFISSLSNFKTGGINSFKSAVDSLSTVNLNGVNAMISEYSASMQSSGVTLANSLTTGLQNGLSTMWSALSSMLTNVVSSIRSRGSAFRAAGRVLVNNLASGISSGRSSVLSAASGVASGSVSSVRNYYSSFWSAGKYLVLGFCAGITENTWRAEAKAALMANAAYESAKEALDVNSPSKVFKRLGSSVPEGFALGLGMFGSEIEDSAIGMANTAIKATRSAMSTVLDALNSDMDSQPTIRPIMDLSDVKTGANAIHGMLNGVQTVGVRTNLNAISSTVNGKLQNGTNDDVVSAINKLNDRLGNIRGDTYTFGNFTYDDGSNISDTIKALIRYSKIGGRV